MISPILSRQITAVSTKTYTFHSFVSVHLRWKVTKTKSKWIKCWSILIFTVSLVRIQFTRGIYSFRVDRIVESPLINMPQFYQTWQTLVNFKIWKTHWYDTASCSELLITTWEKVCCESQIQRWMKLYKLHELPKQPKANWNKCQRCTRLTQRKEERKVLPKETGREEEISKW